LPFREKGGVERGSLQRVVENNHNCSNYLRKGGEREKGSVKWGFYPPSLALFGVKGTVDGEKEIFFFLLVGGFAWHPTGK
jgi:hypothetical protein